MEQRRRQIAYLNDTPLIGLGGTRSKATNTGYGPERAVVQRIERPVAGLDGSEQLREDYGLQYWSDQKSLSNLRRGLHLHQEQKCPRQRGRTNLGKGESTLRLWRCRPTVDSS